MAKKSAALQRGEEEDSHELLRLLLDGLEREELRARGAAPEARTTPVWDGAQRSSGLQNDAVPGWTR